MFILQMEHPVPDYNGWKKAFDSDPLNRKQSGVKSYRICRVKDNPNQVLIELRFNELQQAEAMLAALKQLWNRVVGKVMMNPQSRIIEVAEEMAY